MSAIELLTVAEVAARLRVSRRMVERLLADGAIRSLTIGRRRLVTSREVEAFIAHRAGRRVA